MPVLLVGIAQSQSADDVLSSLRVVGVGALLVFFGVIVLLATFARPLAGALGLPVRAATGVTGRDRARERDAEPAPHRGHRERARDRPRARGDGRDLRRVGEGVGPLRRTTSSGPTS